MQKNKRGISAIVATVLIILITVAAVTIIWAAVIPLIQNQLEGGTTCTEAVSQIILPKEGYTCYVKAGPETYLAIQIKRKEKDFELVDLMALVEYEGNKYSYSLSNESTTFFTEPITMLKENSKRIYVINITSTSLTGNPQSVSIAPTVKIGDSQKECRVSDTVKVEECP